ncbi:hypothetical protein AB0B10_15930 [Micromonospora arborensis]|uniref:hypothetical protein n=1 Tax=Micromonospora arborensis TaxID=2116518 RepID=UPI0033DC7E6B
MTDPTIRAILDASAVIAFRRGLDDVGEVIVAVADEGGYVLGPPELDLAEAARVVADQARLLALLVNHRRC